MASHDSNGGTGDALGADRPDAERPRLPPSIRPWVWGWRPVAIVVGVFVIMQLVPYRIHNSAVVAEPNWPNPQSRELAVRTCYNCHSNHTREPWYSSIAPVSWLLTNHVNGGRNKLNFTEWDSRQAREMRDEVERSKKVRCRRARTHGSDSTKTRS